MAILKQAEGGVPVSKLCREHGMSSASFFKWRATFGGMDASLMSESELLSAIGPREPEQALEKALRPSTARQGIALQCPVRDGGGRWP